MRQIKVRREQAAAVAKVLADLELARRIAYEAQLKADHLCAGVLGGLTGEGCQVVSVDLPSCRITVEEADAAAA